MASLNILLKTIAFVVIAFIKDVVIADDCHQLCGYIAPTTFPEYNKTCDTTGKVLGTSLPLTIYWNDGSQSVFTILVTTQIAIGSCCSAFESAYYATGSVSSGRFAGENLIIAKTFRAVRQTCNGCQSSAGLSRVSSPYMLSIGTKGVGNWIECTGNGTLVWSPAVTDEPQDVYTTEYVDFSDCSNCLQSC